MNVRMLGVEVRDRRPFQRYGQVFLHSVHQVACKPSQIDTLTKTFLTCVPEPPADAKAQAVARARERYDRLLKSTGRAMVGDSRVAMQDLVANVEG